LRIADESYLLVSESDDPVRADGLRHEANAWEILSERETQIAVLVARGKGTKQIAGHLRISAYGAQLYAPDFLQTSYPLDRQWLHN
jgi:DNA-binding NarL/FixJ family response regulator